LLLTAKADSIASEKYGIAKDRYVLGNLSITDLSIASRKTTRPSGITFMPYAISGAPITSFVTWPYMILKKPKKLLTDKNLNRCYDKYAGCYGNDGHYEF
jgi:hypothetical protein